MISGRAIYDVLAATVPLYVAMMLSYVSVKRWEFFSPEQCSGINRFVAVFALPFLSFHLISSTDLYALNYRFIAADSLQKVVILGGLFLWQLAFRNKRGSSSRLEWSITLFSISTLPNTLLMGIPLLKAMYGDFCETLMVQIVVMQCVVWFTLLLFMFEYRGAMQLISEKFFDTAGSINSFRVDSDVVSLDGREPLQADAEIGGDGKMHVVVRRSTSLSASSNTPRISNLRGVEIYSVQSSKRNSFDGGLRGDVFSLQSSKGTNPRVSNFEEGMGKRRGGRSMSGKLFNGGGLVSPYPPPNPRFLRSTSDGCSGDKKKESGGGGSGAVAHINNGNDKELPIFLWSSSGESLVSEGKMRHAISRAASTDFGAVDSSCNKAAAFPNDASAVASKAMRDLIESRTPDGKTINGENEEHIENRISKFSAGGSASTCQEKKTDLEEDGIKKQQMPSASVMTRLILVMVWRKLIRNPNTYASLLGVVWSLISFRWGIKMPSIVKGSISIISDSALGMAMFSLGLFMALQPKAIACGKSVATFAMATRFLMGPAVTAATSIAVGLRGTVLRVAILQAALPQGIVTFVFAKEYNVHADVLSTVIIFGMLIALPVTILYYVLLAL